MIMKIRIVIKIIKKQDDNSNNDDNENSIVIKNQLGYQC